MDSSKSQEMKKAAIPTPPPFPKFKKTIPESVTKQEIARFWRQKRMVEEEHLLAAIKAAARVRARKFTEEDYRRFEESLCDDGETTEDNLTNGKKDEKIGEVRLGIKDWWTKSKYAYLNQPAIGAGAPKKRTTTYAPYCIPHKPAPLYPTALNVS